MGRIWGGWIFRTNLILLFVLPAMISCSKPPPFNSMSEYEQFQFIKESFRKNKLTTTKQWLNQFIVVHPGSVVRDSARFLIGETYFKLDQYLLAAVEYGHLVTELPNSSLADDAAYKRALCYYEMSPSFQRDQEYTNTAILYFQRLLEDYPDTEHLKDVNDKMSELRAKLGRKQFETAKLYQKLEYYKAAVISYDRVLKQYYDSRWVPLALKGKGECHMKLKEYSEAKDVFEDFIARYPKHLDVAAVQEALAKAVKNMPAPGISEQSSR